MDPCGHDKPGESQELSDQTSGLDSSDSTSLSSSDFFYRHDYSVPKKSPLDKKASNTSDSSSCEVFRESQNSTGQASTVDLNSSTSTSSVEYCGRNNESESDESPMDVKALYLSEFAKTPEEDCRPTELLRVPSLGVMEAAASGSRGSAIHVLIKGDASTPGHSEFTGELQEEGSRLGKDSDLDQTSGHIESTRDLQEGRRELQKDSELDHDKYTAEVQEEGSRSEEDSTRGHGKSVGECYEKENRLRKEPVVDHSESSISLQEHVKESEPVHGESTGELGGKGIRIEEKRAVDYGETLGEFNKEESELRKEAILNHTEFVESLNEERSEPGIKPVVNDESAEELQEGRMWEEESTFIPQKSLEVSLEEGSEPGIEKELAPNLGESTVELREEGTRNEDKFASDNGQSIGELDKQENEFRKEEIMDHSQLAGSREEERNEHGMELIVDFSESTEVLQEEKMNDEELMLNTGESGKLARNPDECMREFSQQVNEVGKVSGLDLGEHPGQFLQERKGIGEMSELHHDNSVEELQGERSRHNEEPALDHRKSAGEICKEGIKLGEAAVLGCGESSGHNQEAKIGLEGGLAWKFAEKEVGPEHEIEQCSQNILNLKPAGGSLGFNYSHSTETRKEDGSQLAMKPTKSEEFSEKIEKCELLDIVVVLDRSEADIPPKKKRGRPKKLINLEGQRSALSNDNNLSTFSYPLASKIFPPKKRGRPKKVSTIRDHSENWKFAQSPRPSGILTTDPSHSDALPKRQRGRPRKLETDGANQPNGTEKNQQKNMPNVLSSGIIKRGVGRPRKSDLYHNFLTVSGKVFGVSASSQFILSSTAGICPKKKRGRPRKTRNFPKATRKPFGETRLETVKRPRGRPRTSHLGESLSKGLIKPLRDAGVLELSGSNSSKLHLTKPRGRPRKSLLGESSPTFTIKPSNDAVPLKISDLDSPEIHQKKPRGRPPKRPRESLPKFDIKPFDDPLLDSPSSKTVKGVSQNSLPGGNLPDVTVLKTIKKSRGRPRKHPINLIAASTLPLGSALSRNRFHNVTGPSGRKRGRPRKSNPHTSLPIPTTKSVDDNAIVAESSGPTSMEALPGILNSGLVMSSQIENGETNPKQLRLSVSGGNVTSSTSDMLSQISSSSATAGDPQCSPDKTDFGTNVQVVEGESLGRASTSSLVQKSATNSELEMKEDALSSSVSDRSSEKAEAHSHLLGVVPGDTQKSGTLGGLPKRVNPLGVRMKSGIGLPIHNAMHLDSDSNSSKVGQKRRRGRPRKSWPVVNSPDVVADAVKSAENPREQPSPSHPVCAAESQIHSYNITPISGKKRRGRPRKYFPNASFSTHDSKPAGNCAVETEPTGRNVVQTLLESVASSVSDSDDATAFQVANDATCPKKPRLLESGKNPTISTDDALSMTSSSGDPTCLTQKSDNSADIETAHSEPLGEEAMSKPSSSTQEFGTAGNASSSSDSETNHEKSDGEGCNLHLKEPSSGSEKSETDATLSKQIHRVRLCEQFNTVRSAEGLNLENSESDHSVDEMKNAQPSSSIDDVQSSDVQLGEIITGEASAGDGSMDYTRSTKTTVYFVSEIFENREAETYIKPDPDMLGIHTENGESTMTSELLGNASCFQPFVANSPVSIAQFGCPRVSHETENGLLQLTDRRNWESDKDVSDRGGLAETHIEDPSMPTPEVVQDNSGMNTVENSSGQTIAPGPESASFNFVENTGPSSAAASNFSSLLFTNAPPEPGCLQKSNSTEDSRSDPTNTQIPNNTDLSSPLGQESIQFAQRRKKVQQDRKGSTPVTSAAKKYQTDSERKRDRRKKLNEAENVHNQKHDKRFSPEHPRALIPALCKQMYKMGWMAGTGGSMTVKDNELFYITPSGVPKERLLPFDLFVLDNDGNFVEGPSEEKKMKITDNADVFRAIYSMRDAGAIIHSHSPKAVMITLICKGQEFRISHQETIKGMLKGSSRERYRNTDTLVIPIVENLPSERDLKEPVILAMQQYPMSNAVLIRRHGLYVWGDSWKTAKGQAECLDYLFDLALDMNRHGINPAAEPTDEQGITLKRT